jgi:hypothetical protein
VTRPFRSHLRRFLLGCVCHKAMVVGIIGMDPRHFVTQKPKDKADAA